MTEPNDRVPRLSRSRGGAPAGPLRDDPAIEAAAQDWFLVLSSGNTTADDLRDFETWRSADPRHRAAYDELCRIWEDVEPLRHAFAAGSERQAPMQARDPAAGVGRRPRRLSRRATLWGGLAAACVAVALAMPELTTRLSADYRTGVGEQARVTLADGSVAWLNTDTAIAVDFGVAHRHVRLLRGEAQFAVAKDAARPFAVSSGGGRSTALGTVYAVHDRATETTVTVVEGRVEVASPAGDTAAPAVVATTLSAGQQVSYRPGVAPGTVRKAAAGSLAWRDGFIMVDGLPLAEALAEIDRYRPGRIVLLADGKRPEPVTARLSLDALDDGLDALAATQGLRVSHLTGLLAIVH